MSGSGDEIEVYQKVGQHKVVHAVKSEAVMKYSMVRIPADFNRLKHNTNLNLPPSNWLSCSERNYYLHNAVNSSTGFGSFRMAHTFPDCVDDVDVISNAENIKRLLKIPYNSKSVICMIVHRIGNTLLLDEFDIQKYVLRAVNNEWKWLSDFVVDHIMKCGNVLNVCLRDKSRNAIQRRNLLSKFLYYSLKETNVASPGLCVPPADAQLPARNNRPLPIIGPVLPEPTIEENVPDPKSSHMFNRNVIWTFEDIRMFIGSDMPIFGGPNRPCISLRLRDMAKPINVLTGMDYWLDNLMCNVPEVVMCYHIDGIVQKYEFVKTEDLPYLENSQFSPQIVRDMAKHILSFLNANATKSGHTYWLFKGRNDDVVKLYDLTTLANNSDTGYDKHFENPFTVPVAMLLYRVARNMKNTAVRLSPKKAGSICALLNNCIKLLPKEKYSQIVTSSYYLLSDLYIPDGIDPQCPKFDCSDGDSDTQSLFDEDLIDENETDDEFFFNKIGQYGYLGDDMHDNVAEMNIGNPSKQTNGGKKCDKNIRTAPSPPLLVANVEERCRISMKHISDGISCLQFFNENEEKFIKETEERAKVEEKLRILHEELNPNMVESSNSIPLPYERLNPHQYCANKDAMEVHFTKDNNNTNDNYSNYSNNIVANNKNTTTTTTNNNNKNTNNTNNNNEYNQNVSDDTEHKGNKKLKNKRNKNKECPKNANVKSTNRTAQKTSSVIKFNSQYFGSWSVHLKMLLLEKACLINATCAELHYGTQNYGSCLKVAYIAFRCHEVIEKHIAITMSQKSYLMMRVGDCFLQMVKNWSHFDEYVAQLHDYTNDELIINGELEKHLEGEDSPDVIEPVQDMEKLMLYSIMFYEKALKSAPLDIVEGNITYDLFRRLGNVQNELGLKYMYWAQEESRLVQAYEGTTKDEETELSSIEALPQMKMAMKSYDCLTRGIVILSQVQDDINLAFLHCNMGRFLRFRAHLNDTCVKVDQTDMFLKQKKFYTRAFEHYEKALTILGSRKRNTDLWDLVTWELSTATFTLAKQMQDHDIPTSLPSDYDKELLSILHKSLELCDVDHANSRQVLYTYRSGLIHNRIARLHNREFRNSLKDAQPPNKVLLQLCKFHFEKAANILMNLHEINESLTLQIERICLQETIVDGVANTSTKIRELHYALDVCLSSQPVFEYAANNINVEDNVIISSSVDRCTTDNVQYLITMFEKHLQTTLKTLIKLLLSTRDPKNMAECYKRMYMLTLTAQRHRSDVGKLNANAIMKDMADCLSKMKAIQNSHVDGTTDVVVASKKV